MRPLLSGILALHISLISSFFPQPMTANHPGKKTTRSTGPHGQNRFRQQFVLSLGPRLDRPDGLQKCGPEVKRVRVSVWCQQLRS